MLLRRLLLSLLLLVLANVTCAETIEQSMSAAEFKAAGLDKLSPDELANLNTWLQSRGQAPVAATQTPSPASTESTPVAAAAPAPAQPAGPPILSKYRKDNPEAEAAAPKTVDLVESRIVGYFEGWRKGTIFKLENGQHWRVTDDRRYEIGSEDSPTVVIEAAMMGSWLMRVGDHNRRARVQRIK
jgi:hypothetical protein